MKCSLFSLLVLCGLGFALVGCQGGEPATEVTEVSIEGMHVAPDVEAIPIEEIQRGTASPGPGIGTEDKGGASMPTPVGAPNPITGEPTKPVKMPPPKMERGPAPRRLPASAGPQPKVVEGGGPSTQPVESDFRPPEAPQPTGKAEPAQAAPSQGAERRPEGTSRVLTPIGMETQSQDWKPVNRNLVALGRALDKSIRGMKGSVGKNRTFYKNAEGEGQSELDMWVESSSRFRIEYPVLGRTLQRGIAVSDGKQLAVFNGTRWAVNPMTKATFAPDTLLAEWPRRFPELHFAPITRNGNTYEALFTALSRGSGGYKAQVEERVSVSGSASTPFIRVTARNGAGAEIGVVVQGARMLPVTLTFKEGRTDVFFTLGWDFNQKIDPDRFNLPERQMLALR